MPPEILTKDTFIKAFNKIYPKKANDMPTLDPGGRLLTSYIIDPHEPSVNTKDQLLAKIDAALLRVQILLNIEASTHKIIEPVRSTQVASFRITLDDSLTQPNIETKTSYKIDQERMQIFTQATEQINALLLELKIERQKALDFLQTNGG